jgi:hypothetical protein
MNVPGPDLSLRNECKSSLFRVNNTFLFFLVASEAAPVWRSDAPCVHFAAQDCVVTFPGLCDTSMRADLRGRCNPDGGKVALRLDEVLMGAGSMDSESEGLV